MPEQINIKSAGRTAWVLKASVFATGLSGIVAEYVMSTLASYLLGNTVLQWTLTLSFMLFAMGVGSRVSKYIINDLLDVFIAVEFTLSLLTGISAVAIYFLSIYIQSVSVLIYLTAFAIGFLIGLEIPLVTRLNNMFEELRINISSVMEKDYYGSLLGGLFFAFFALPKLGLTYTPILLGGVNFSVALLMVVKFRKYIKYGKTVAVSAVSVPVFLFILALIAKPVVLFGEQHKYMDHIIYEKQTPYQKIVITQWKKYYWLYLNGNEQFSSFDEYKYHEALVHPAMQLKKTARNILILGGGDGLAAREILKYGSVDSITLVDLDPAVTDLGKNHPVFVRLNRNSLQNPKVRIINTDAYVFLKKSNTLYDVIFIDLPDPKNVTLARLYSVQFYRLVRTRLGRNGIVVTQATSPFFSRKAFICILKSIKAAGFTAVGYHNHIPTLGEWGFVLGLNNSTWDDERLSRTLRKQKFNTVPVRYINDKIMCAMLTFGNDMFTDYDSVEINEELNLKLFEYYDKGEWDFY